MVTARQATGDDVDYDGATTTMTTMATGDDNDEDDGNGMTGDGRRW